MIEAAVLDASAVLHASSPGPRFDALTALQERVPTSAPALLAWELGSVVHGRRAPAYGATPARRGRALELMLAGIELVPTDEAARGRCGALAAKHSLTFYDASYLELAARRDDVLLVTHDGGLLAAGSRVLGKGRALDLEGVAQLLLEG